MKATPFFPLLAALLLFSCKKETEELQLEAPGDYLPAKPGKFITYRTDSTVFVNFGSTTVVRSYQEKHQVDAQITDNLGRPAYRVFRFIRDTAGATAWRPNGSYFITPLNNTVEVVENNLRFLKLIAPVREGTAWKQNRFLPTDPYGGFYEFSNDDDMHDWDYAFFDVDKPAAISGRSFGSTVTVRATLDQAETNVKNNFQVQNALFYGSKNYATEIYGKGIGLLYQEVIMWEYQPPSTQRSGYRGFGVKRSVIDYN